MYLVFKLQWCGKINNIYSHNIITENTSTSYDVTTDEGFVFHAAEFPSFLNLMHSSGGFDVDSLEMQPNSIVTYSYFLLAMPLILQGNYCPVVSDAS